MPTNLTATVEQLDGTTSTARLPLIIEALLPRDALEVDDLFRDPQLRRRLVNLVSRACRDAYLGGDGSSRLMVQTILGQLYNLTLRIPPVTNAQGAVVLVEIQRVIERHLVGFEETLVDQDTCRQNPGTYPQYGIWLKELIRSHSAFKHPLYDRYLPNDATVSDLRHLIRQESTVDARFDDLIALMQVGTDGPIKLEMASNYWDEMGNGRAALVHSLMFSEAVDALHIEEVDGVQDLAVEALNSGNLAVMLCLYRRYFFRAIGFFAVTEYLVPHRFDAIVKCWERLGIDRKGAEYHRQHISIDARHAAGWFGNVIRPLVDADPMVGREITHGALWRLNSSSRYMDELMSTLRSTPIATHGKPD